MEMETQSSVGTLTPEGSGSGNGTGVGGDVAMGGVVAVNEMRRQKDASESLVDGDIPHEEDEGPASLEDGEGENKDEEEKPIVEQKSDNTPENNEDKWEGVNPSSPRAKSIVYDPNGDLTLTMNPSSDYDDQSQHNFHVSSKLLSHTSPVWNDLTSDASVSTSSENMTISLNDGDCHSLDIFLKITHFQFSELPPLISFEDLYNLARFSEKYGVFEMLLPFVKTWIEPFLREELDPERVEWVLIAWEFCLAHVFAKWLVYLCQEAEKDTDGKLLYRGRRVAGLFPEACREKYTEYIEERRIRFISSLLSLCKWGFENDLCYHVSGENKYRGQCNAMKDGYLMAGLNGLLNKWKWLMNDELPSSITTSARAIKEGLLHIQLEPLPPGGEGSERGKEEESHLGCGIVSFKHEIMGCSLDGEEMGSALTERFGKGRLEAECGMLPMLKRLGFWKTDFMRPVAENQQSGSDDRFSYQIVEWEPREEYESEAVEESSSDDSSGDDDDDDGGDSSGEDDQEMEIDK